MKILRRVYPLILLFPALITVSSLVIPPYSSEAAAQRTLAWSVVDTPWNGLNGMIIGPVGINSFALGPDNRTFYAADTANYVAGGNPGFYKSTDAGYSWLLKATPSSPVWNVAVAPDDEKFVVIVTDAAGPGNVYFSIDGGSNWENPPLPAFSGYISCIDVSKKYGTSNQYRDIAVGTRPVNIGLNPGQVFNIQYSATTIGAWTDQAFPQLPSNNSVSSLKFSPNYDKEQVIVAVSGTSVSTFINFGLHSTSPNTTLWNADAGYTGYPKVLTTLLPPKTFPEASTIVTDLELPSDFSASDLPLRGCFASILAATASAVYYINSNISPDVIDITPRLTTTGQRGIYSIAYVGNSTTGMLLAGESTTTAGRGCVTVWQCSNPQATTVGAATWLPSDKLKSPTGGGNANNASSALLAWSADGSTAYCGTSADYPTLGGTGASPRWPLSKTASAGIAGDESAFQYSTDNGFAWNQIGLINTHISQLSDSATHQQGEGDGSGTLYLSSLNTVAPGFDSIWRSTSDPLGQTWERILTFHSSDNGALLRINPWDSASRVIVFADFLTDNISCSSDGGDTWATVLAGMNVKDLTLVDDSNMYVLDDYTVRKVSGGGSTWTPGKKINTELLAPGHTLCTPESNGSIVFVGTEGNSDTRVAWVDFAQLFPKFTELKELPEQGNVHVVIDDQYAGNKIIYAGINVDGADDGNIYRWKIGDSTNWDELDPANREFYGLCMLNDILYGAWDSAIAYPYIIHGVDRTLDARVKVPPAPEWDTLRDGLPDTPFSFTREPTSLHTSSNAYNTLWAIDNQDYNFTSNLGCLWQYIDSVARLGPWPTAPPPGGFIGPDPSSGRSQQIDLRWRPLRDIFGYDVLIAKDVNFTLPLSQVLNLSPVDDLTGAWVVEPADQESPSCWISPGVLEVGRSYYWRVRGSRSIIGTKIHSPWSPTLFFSVKPGFRVTADYMGPTLLAPVDGICSNCKPPIRFSWSPIKNATTYEFILARNAQLTDIVVQEKTKSTALEVKSKLQLATPYFWQVKAVAPIPSDPSPVGTFSLSENKTSPQKPAATKTKPGGVAAPADFWIWLIIVIVVVLLMLINAYVFISRRRDG
jgi:hypothetical protein